MKKLKLKGIVWTIEPVLTEDLPKEVEIVVDEDAFETAKEEKVLTNFLKYELSELFVFTPVSIRTYQVIN